MRVASMLSFVSVLSLSVGLAGDAGAAPKATSSSRSLDLYFGDLHAHTGFSDGWGGTPGDAYAQAREAGADFMGTSDHNFMLTQDEWTQTLDMAGAGTDARFAALPGSEYWLASGFGEVIVYNVSELRNDANFHDPDLNPLSRHEVIPAFYDWLAAHPGAIGLWPHPGLYGDLDEFEHRTDSRDAAMSMIEIHNYGSFVGAPASWGLHDYEPAYQMALEKGWHVLPAATSDTHDTDWIIGSPVRTVLLAPSPDPADLYEAMRLRRGYGTLDSNLRIRYSLNGEVMGAILPAPATSYQAVIEIEDPDGTPEDVVTRVEIVSDHGEVVASIDTDDTVVEWTATLESATARYFYVRVHTASNLTDAGGVTAWTAPVWTGR